jgi:two-component system cell cycle sensor histidine kinase/response regulator CckA
MQTTDTQGVSPTAVPSKSEAVRTRSLRTHDLVAQASDTLEMVHKKFNKGPHEYAAVLEGDKVIGICSRSHVGQVLGAQYGFQLFCKKPVREFLLPNCLVVTESTPERTILDRAFSRVGNDWDVDVIEVDEHGKYVGLIPAQELVLLQSQIVSEQMRFLQEQEGALRQNNSELARALNDLRQSQERLRRSEDQLRQSQKMEAVGRLAGGVAHDFNNLLTVITGYCALLSRKVSDQPELSRNVDEIEQAANRAAALTRQLLAFSRRQVLQPRVLDVNEIIKGMEPMVRRLIGEDIELCVQPHPALKCIKADAGQIEQVLMNLIVNSRDAMPMGGRLTIATDSIRPDNNSDLRLEGQNAATEYCVLSVSDTGVGMTEEVKAHLFEPFFTTKGVGKGTGLGLATCYGIIKQSNGHIRVSSKTGEGTTFWIFLPTVEDRLTNQPVKTEGTSPKPCSGTVLVVEDDNALRELSRVVLTSEGFNVLTAENGVEGIRVVRAERKIDLIITDVIMPLMGGREMVDQLRSTHPQVKLIYVSGYTADALTRGGELDAEITFIEKPYSPAQLIEKVRELLTAKELEAA